MNPSEEATTTWSSSEPEDGSSSPMALLTTTLSSLMEAAMNESGYDVSTTGMPPVPIDPPIGKCNYYVKNSTVVVIDFTNQYGGIPQNLVFNLIGWFLLVLAFAFLRRTAGNYGRLALVRKDDDDSKWTQLFFAPDDVSSDSPEARAAEEEEILGEPDSLASMIDFNEVDNGLCSWVWSIFTLSDEKYLRKCGVDAVQYLKFQRHLIIFVLIMTVVCVAVILPINFQGNIQGTDVDFGHTTISNLKGTDNRLWVHVIIVILFLPLGIFIMRKFSVTLKIDGTDQCISSRTLMIVGIPEAFCSKDNLIRHFHEAYPDSEIDDVQIAYDVSDLSSLDLRRERARRARQYCENYVSKHGAGQQMRPFLCGIVCCCGKTVDALNFYQKEERQLILEVEKEKARIQTKSIGIAFVTFNRLSDAKTVNRDHSGNCCDCLSNPPVSTVSNVILPQNWSVRFAPPPDDIYWENLNDTHRLFFVKALLINIVLFVVLFFFTSPTYIISQLEPILNFKNFTSSEKINDFLPTLLLWTLTALLPIIVAYSDWCMGHWRRSVENLWIMRKVFFYLLFMVLILPSIGLTSLKAFFEFFINSGESPSHNRLVWSCIFLPDNGAFFVNYIITSALIGTALELMRFSELFMYAMRMLFARSVAETPSVRKANLYEFMFGFNYGWMLLIFALTSAYAVVCPLITPFGLFYMVMKHGVDRYNLYFAYKRSKINKNIHATAVNCVIVSLLIQQLILLFFNIIRSPDEGGKILSPRAIFSMTALVLSTVLFIAQIFFHMFKGISPLQYIQSPSGVSPPLDETGGDFPTFGGDHNAGGLANVSSNLGMFDDATPNNGAVLNTTASARRRTKRQKQFVPDVMRRDLYTSTAMVNTSLASSLRNNGDPHSGGGGLSPVISSQPGLSSSASGAYGATSGQQLLMQDRE